MAISTCEFSGSPCRFLALVALTAALAAPASAVDVWTRKGGTLSADPQGWAYSPSLASAADGTLYAVWTQHRKADVYETAGPRAAVWNGGAWQPLGGRIGDDVAGYDPQIAVFGGT